MPKCANFDTGTYKGTEPSPKGLGLCARGENMGHRIKGLDGNIWEVKATKTGTKRWVKITLDKPKNKSAKKKSAKNKSAKNKSAKNKSAKNKSAKKKSAKKKSAKKKSAKKKSAKKKSAKKKSAKNKSAKKKSAKKKSAKKKSAKKKSAKKIKNPTLLQQIKSNPWMEDILKKKINNEKISDYDKDLFNMMQNQPLPPGGMTKLLKKYKK